MSKEQIKTKYAEDFAKLLKHVNKTFKLKNFTAADVTAYCTEANMTPALITHCVTAGVIERVERAVYKLLEYNDEAIDKCIAAYKQYGVDNSQSRRDKKAEAKHDMSIQTIATIAEPPLTAERAIAFLQDLNYEVYEPITTHKKMKQA